MNAHTHATSTKPPAKWFDSWTWPLIILGFLSFDLVLFGVVMYVTIGDRSVSVEDGYYEKSLAWDEREEGRKAVVAAFGQPELTIEPLIAGRSEAKVAVRFPLLDAAGLPTAPGESSEAPATIIAGYFHHATSADRFEAPLEWLGGGRFAAPLAIDRAGLWNIRLSVTVGEQTGVIKLDRFVEVVGAAGKIKGG